MFDISLCFEKEREKGGGLTERQSEGKSESLKSNLKWGYLCIHTRERVLECLLSKGKSRE